MCVCVYVNINFCTFPSSLGVFGKVYSGSIKRGGVKTIVAVKTIKGKNKSPCDSEQYQNLFRDQYRGAVEVIFCRESDHEGLQASSCSWSPGSVFRHS